MAIVEKWDQGDIADQAGRVIVVTGANSGIGFETAAALAQKGGTIVLACRSEERGQDAAKKIKERGAKGTVEVQQLDLASLGSVRVFASRFLDDHDRLDLLINNAGVMTPPFGKTEDGFELQIGINHLGHFALCGLLIDTILATDGSRVVSVSSLAHKAGEIDLEDLSWDHRKYKAWKAYGQSKLANLLFTFELQRRLALAGSKTIATAAHPGWTGTDLQKNMKIAMMLNPLLAQKTARGALPTLYAAVAPTVAGGEYFGPGGLFELRGYPVRVGSATSARDAGVALGLWRASEGLVKVNYDALPGS